MCVFKEWKAVYGGGVNGVFVWGLFVPVLTNLLGLPLVNRSFDPLSTTKENRGYERRREEDNMNIIFWILEEDIPYRPLYE